MTDVRAELMRVQALHQEIVERLKTKCVTDSVWVMQRFEGNFMSPEFHARCVADYARWIKEWDAQAAELKEARERIEALELEALADKYAGGSV